MRIGTLRPRNPFFLAPMAGHTCSSMRRLCVELGAGMVVTEMTVAMHLVRAQHETMRLLRFDEKTEHPIVAQLAAWDPDSARDATKFLEGLGFDGVDLNLGCSVRRIVTGGMGSALAADPKRVAAVLSAMVSATSLPVTVKMRSGPDETTVTAPEIAKVCADCGAAAVAVHARHAQQAYRGAADWNVIARVREAVRVPVIGNGDVKTAADGVRMMRETGCDAVMIGRGALGNPWIFKQAAHLLASGAPLARPPIVEVRRVMLRHYALLLEERNRHYANLLFRKQATHYAKFTRHPKDLRQAVHHAGNDDDLAKVIRELVR